MVKRIYSFLLPGLQMEINRSQEDQKLSLPPMDSLFSMEAKRYGRQRLGLGVGAHCAVTLFEDLRFANGTERYWRKRLPLSNGRLDQTAVAGSALIKILKSNELTSGRGKQNKAILILSVLLGASVFLFNYRRK
ncbi:hypothetical protein CK203_028927 [Vitis vinifera]|uniref:Uncharacterized protein n=1 Tax=Vitis vinifera TaxID=29760 RepID=A0A438IA18_VITVI|nr:hypothetical protein CK203_028927 [Vitis vinifera]